MFQVFYQLISELRKNTRLRIGIWLIMAILIGYAATFLNNHKVQLENNYKNALTRLSQLQNIADQTQWAKRSIQVQELHTQLKARLWEANTKGLAQAIFQSWFQEEIYFAQISKPALNVEAALEVPKSSLWQVSARLNGAFIPKRLHQLLLEIAKSPRIIVIERLEIRKSPTPRFTLIIKAYFQESTTSS
ncbi:hypothetical protein [Candidatus Parabeggiatoa sp. HSG14]|uniref:hypothetical protein n=1 Tax=Candidatus Parabeggiatoa sp. HSG14 TaxID=3055593 RepID=UPI0025A8BDA2|nr:hypothetical protein [Thiotrichales bacterium HSG14]